MAKAKKTIIGKLVDKITSPATVSECTKECDPCACKEQGYSHKYTITVVIPEKFYKAELERYLFLTRVNGDDTITVSKDKVYTYTTNRPYDAERMVYGYGDFDEVTIIKTKNEN